MVVDLISCDQHILLLSPSSYDIWSWYLAFYRNSALTCKMLETDTSIYICNIYAAPFSFIPGLWKPREPRCHLGSPRIANFSLTNFHQRSGVEMPWYFLSFNLSVFWKSSWFEMISKRITAALYIFVFFCSFCKFPWNSGKSWNVGPYPLVKAYMSFRVHVYTLGLYIKWWNLTPVIQLIPYFCPWLFTCSLHLSTLNRWIWWS